MEPDRNAARSYGNHEHFADFTHCVGGDILQRLVVRTAACPKYFFARDSLHL